MAKKPLRILDMTGTFPAEIPTSRNEGETPAAYKARLVVFKRQMNGNRRSRMPGYKDTGPLPQRLSQKLNAQRA